MVTQVRSFKDQIFGLRYKASAAIRNILMDDRPPGTKLKRPGGTPTAEEVAEFSQKHSIASILPYESYDEDAQIYFNKDTLGFVLIGSGATGLTEHALTTLNNLFVDNHPINTCIQITMLDDARIEPILESWRRNREAKSGNPSDAIFNAMAEERVAYLKTGKWKSLFTDIPFLVRDFKLIISYTIPMNPDEKRFGVSDDVVVQLSRTRDSMLNILESAGIFTKPLVPEEFLTIMNEILNPSTSEHPQMRWDKNMPLNMQMVDSETSILLDAGASTIIHKDEMFSVIPFQIRQFPEVWAGYRNTDLIGSFTSNLHRLPCKFIATLVVRIPEQQSAQGKASAKSLRASQMVDSPIAKFVPQWKDRNKDWTYVQDKLKGGDKLLRASYQIMLITPQGTEKQAESKLRALYDSIAWLPTKTRYLPKQSLMAVLPMGLTFADHEHLELMGTYKTMLAWNCTQVAPWIAEWKGTKTPLMLFLGRRGQITFFNPFDNDGNYNIAVMAAPGAGKSFVTNEWAMSIRATGGKVFIIDAGGSYKNICTLLKGTYIDFADKSIRINPFSSLLDDDALHKLAVESGTNVDSYKAEYFKDWLPMLKELIGQMASPNEPLTNEQSACLVRAIDLTLKSKGNRSTITDVRDCLETLELKASLKDIAERVALMLDPYTKDGMHGSWFDGESNIDLTNDFVVLELDALNAKGDLQSVVLLILMIQINKAILLSGDKSRRKICIIDEAWRLLSKGRAGDFIQEGYRVCRKHGGSFATITQSVADYYTSPTAEAAFKCSDFKFYLRQSGEDLSRAQKEKYIDDADGKVSLMRTLETSTGRYSEIAIGTNRGMSVVRFCVDPFTEKVYSTKPDEVEEIRRGEREGRELTSIIREMVSRQKGKR